MAFGCALRPAMCRQVFQAGVAEVVKEQTIREGGHCALAAQPGGNCQNLFQL
jgi:hypothetical protein